MNKTLLALTTAAFVVPLFPIDSLVQVAEAGHTQQYRQRSLRVIAHDLEEVTRFTYQALEHRNSSRHYRDSRALSDLHSLASRARHFRQVVERYHRDPWHTLKDYESLATSYNRAHQHLRYMRVSENLLGDFRRIEYLMAELDAHYRRASYRTRRGARYEERHHRYPTYRGHRSGDYRVRIQLPRIEIQWNWWH